MSLSTVQKLELKSKAHTLKNVVIVGRGGLTDSIVQNIRSAFTRSELVKVKIKLPKEEAMELTEKIATQTPCELVTRTGFVSVFYRPLATLNGNHK